MDFGSSGQLMAVSHPTCAIEAGHGWAVGWVIAGYAAGISVSRVQVKHPTAPEAMRRPAWRFVAVKLEHFAGAKVVQLSMPCNEAWLLQEAKVTPGRIWLDLVMDPMYFRGKIRLKILIN